MKKVAIAIMLFTACAPVCERPVLAQTPATVNVVGPLVQGVPPQPVAGRIVLSWESFTSPDGYPVQKGYREINVGSNGAYTIAIVPNVGGPATGSSYSVEIFLPGARINEVWVVPGSPGPYTRGQVVVTNTPARSVTVQASQITGTLASSLLPTAQRRRTCNIVIGADNATSPLTNLDISPQGHQCWIPANATIVEINVSADAGTPSLRVARNHQGSVTNLTSAALQTGSAGVLRCANAAGSGLGIDGVTTCTVALAATSLTAGDFLDVNGGVAGGVAKKITAAITFTVD